MTAQESLEALKGLHQDLIALSESRLATVERLWTDLEGHIEAFKKLLDKSSKNAVSRKAVSSGMHDFVAVLSTVLGTRLLADTLLQEPSTLTIRIIPLTWNFKKILYS